MNPSHAGRADRNGAGFTLVEALVAISLAAMAGSVLLLGINGSLKTTNDAMYQTIATAIAQQLVDEAIGNRYMEYTEDPYAHPLGPGGAEAATGTRATFDDIDDFHGFQSQPPVDAWGVPLGKDNGAGGQRHANFLAPAGFFDRWKQQISVYFVSESNPQAAPSQISDRAIAVEVKIQYVDPLRGARDLANIRRVVAYVPPPQ